MTPLRAEAWLFDLDGTLVDSTTSVLRTWMAWADEFGVDPRLLADSHGVPSQQTVAAVVEPSLAERALRRIEELELADAAVVRAMPGAVDLLAGLPPDRWAVVTSCSRPLARARLEAAGLPVSIPMITADDVGRGKPDPEPYLRGAALVGREPDACVVAEDAPSGIASARGAGMAVIGIVSTHDGDRLAADLVVTDLRDLVVTGEGPFEVTGRSPGTE